MILPTDGYRANAFLSAAASLGVDVIVATNESLPMSTEMEDRLIVVDLAHAEESAALIAAFVERDGIDAVVGVDDQGVVTASHANELLGLRHNPPDAVAATRDKAEMRSIFAAWSIDQPEFRVTPLGADIAKIATTIGFPCVIKPVSLSASTGVIRVDSAEDAVHAEKRIRSILVDHGRPSDEPLLVERFIPGPEISLEGLMVNGELQVLALFDKPDPLNGPYFEETIYVTPSRLSSTDQNRVIRLTTEGCQALGLNHGPIHAEVRLEQPEQDASELDGTAVADDRTRRPRLLEVAARSIGGLCARVLQFGTDISLEEVILRNALGIGIEGIPDPIDASGVMMIPIPRSGILGDVQGVTAAAAVEGVNGVEMTATIGRPIEALPEGGKYLGFIFARGSTPGEVESSLRQAHAELQITISTQDDTGHKPGSTDAASEGNAAL